MRTDIDAEALLILWECALDQPAVLRDDALLRGAHDGGEAGGTLGQRNANLIELHARLFGHEIELLSHCPACAAAAQFSSDCEALAEQLRPKVDNTMPHRLEAQGYEVEFRLPEGSDIASASSDDADFVESLLDCCILACTRDGKNVPPREVPAVVLDALSHRMEALDPGASVSFALACPQCATHWEAPLDIGELVWQKVRSGAERVLLEVDLLARAYGWTEREVLRLTPLRRAAYLQMVTA